MGGLPLGLMEELVADRQARVAGSATGRRHRRQSQAASSGGRERARPGRRVVRGAGRLLVAAGVRLAGPEAAEGRVVLAHGRR